MVHQPPDFVTSDQAPASGSESLTLRLWFENFQWKIFIIGQAFWQCVKGEPTSQLLSSTVSHSHLHLGLLTMIFLLPPQVRN